MISIEYTVLGIGYVASEATDKAAYSILTTHYSLPFSHKNGRPEYA